MRDNGVKQHGKVNVRMLPGILLSTAFSAPFLPFLKNAAKNKSGGQQASGEVMYKGSLLFLYHQYLLYVRDAHS